MSFSEQEEKARKEICCNCKYFRLYLIGAVALIAGKCSLLGVMMDSHSGCKDWQPAATDKEQEKGRYYEDRDKE